MGNKQTHFTEEQLETYLGCTFFTRKEIIRLFKRYYELSPDTVPFNMSNIDSQTIKISHRAVESIPELRENPFRSRICEVFSKDADGHMTFDDFLDMFSVFSEAAPRDIKSIYAFKIYDFDGDNLLEKEDMTRLVNCITRGELTESEVEFVCDKIFSEADIDENQSLTYTEFEQVISRAPDFISNFHFRI